MASLKYHKDVKRWRVFWHVTLPDGSIDKGSRSFKLKDEGQKFKEHCEKQGAKLKRARIVKVPLLDDAVESWRIFMGQHTERTQKMYSDVLRDFLIFASNDLLASDLTSQHIMGYLNSLIARGLGNKSVNNHLCAIKSFCGYLETNYQIPSSAKNIKKFKEGDIDVYFTNRNEYNLILEHCDDIGVGWIRFIANTGLRASEFCNLKWGDYDADARTITVIGKGRKRRTIGLNNIAVTVLEDRRAGKKIKLKDHIFLRKDGLPLIRHTLHYFISKACCDAGVTSFGPHTLRHFFATELLKAGIPIIKVSQLMGHSSVTTTQKHYSHILSSDVANATSVLEALG